MLPRVLRQASAQDRLPSARQHPFTRALRMHKNGELLIWGLKRDSGRPDFLFHGSTSICEGTALAVATLGGTEWG